MALSTYTLVALLWIIACLCNDILVISCGHVRHHGNGRMVGLSRKLVTIQRPSNNSSNVQRRTSKEDGSTDLRHSIYSPWSEWSPCSRKCKQERSRQCNAPWACGNVLVKEERSCTGRRCKRRPFTVVDRDDELSQRELTFTAIKNMHYTSWSQWSPCTRSCRTRRYRMCKMEVACGSSVIQEDAFCYVKGTGCERAFRKKRKDVDPNKEPKVEMTQKEPASANFIPEDCGVTNVSDMALKIIGGQPVVKGRWPWQAAILDRYKEAFCGGTLVAPQWVMTAAHCIRKRLYVRLGEHDISAPEGTEREYRVTRVHMHPDYDIQTVDNDIALLRLSSPAILDKHVQVACLPKQGAPLPQDKLCTILGWGKEKHMASLGTELLHEAKVPIVDVKNCLEVYEDYYITGNMFCAGYRKGRVDSCAGDSGGPLLCETNNRWHVYGITSFGEDCGRRGKYGIYAKVPNYITWIEATINNSDSLGTVSSVPPPS